LGIGFLRNLRGFLGSADDEEKRTIMSVMFVDTTISARFIGVERLVLPLLGC